MRDVGANGETKILERWSLLLSKVQAVALDRAGVPHPALMIPITQESFGMWIVEDAGFLRLLVFL